MKKLGRTFELEIETGDAADPSDVIRITNPLTLEFSVCRNTFASANTGNFKIHNLAESTRTQIFKDKYRTDIRRKIRLRAGYGNTKSEIFFGDYQDAFSYRQGAGIVTEINALDGVFAMRNGFTSQTIAAGTAMREMLATLAKDMPGIMRAFIGEFTGQNKRGATLFGNSYEQIQTLTNGQCSVDCGVLKLLGPDEVIDDGGDVFVINSQAGLLGSPRRADAQLVAEMMFEPRLTIGQAVNLESTTAPIYNGTYQVCGIEHAGIISDAVGGELKTTVSMLVEERSFKRIKEQPLAKGETVANAT